MGCVRLCAASRGVKPSDNRQGYTALATARVDHAGGGQDQTHASSPAAVPAMSFSSAISRTHCWVDKEIITSRPSSSPWDPRLRGSLLIQQQQAAVGQRA